MSPDWIDKLDEAERKQLQEQDMPGSLEPMLATLTDDYFSDPGWIFERKLDGERVLAFKSGGEMRLRTRNGKSACQAYPELAGALAAQKPDAFILDGEVVAFEGNVTSFSRLQTRMQVNDAEETRGSHVPVYYYVFDILHLNGHCLENLPLRVRKSVLWDVFDFSDPVRFTPHRNEDGKAFLEEACRKGWEGLIAKKADGPYVRHRTRDWLKFKCVRQQEFVIGGFTKPQGNRTRFGALLLGYYENGALNYAGRVGTGFDTEERDVLHGKMEPLITEDSPFEEAVPDRETSWVSPELVAEIGFTEWTHKGRLRHPRYLGLRRDKDAQDVVKEVAEDE